jgi:hypothetical protein
MDSIEFVARVVHEAIRSYQLLLGETPAPIWEEAGWRQDSTREGVLFAMNNPTPGAQHEDWVRSKISKGWKYGPIKDETLKTHPSLIPFSQLSQTEKNKDAILIAIVQSLKNVLE